MIDYLCYCSRRGRDSKGLLISINLKDRGEAFQAKHFCQFGYTRRAYFSSPSVIPPEQSHIPTWSLSSSSLAMMLSCRAAKAARAQGAGLPPTMSVCAIFRVMFWSTMLIDQSVPEPVPPTFSMRLLLWMTGNLIFRGVFTIQAYWLFKSFPQNYIWFYLYMQSGMSTFASRSKTGFKSYIPKLMMTLEVQTYIWSTLPRDPKNAAAVWRRKFKQFGLVREELKKMPPSAHFPILENLTHMDIVGLYFMVRCGWALPMDERKARKGKCTCRSERLEWVPTWLATWQWVIITKRIHYFPGHCGSFHTQ